MLFKNIGIVDENFDYVKSMFVETKDDRIVYVSSVRPENYEGEEYDGTGKVLMPGFVNAHSHSPMTLLRGYAENLPLQRWLNEKVFPFEDRIKGEDAYYSSMLAIAEMLRYGTVSFSDMYFFSENVAKAVTDSGIKCNFSRAITSFEDTDIENLQSFRESEDIVKRFHNAADGRLKIDMSLHAEYTNRRTIIEQFAEKVRERGLRAHIHLSETKKEHEECKAKYSLTPTQLFCQCGVFDVPTTAAHCVWVEDGDIELLREKGVTAATCPASNLKLGSGICNVYKLLKSGVNVAIGTDSVASNNNLNMIKEMFLCALLPKGLHNDASVVSERDILKMATVNGYKAQGREDSGAIKAGYKADLCVLNIESEHMYPQTDMINNLVYAADGADVVLTMADGRVLYKDGEFTTIDIEKVKSTVNAAASRIISEVKKNG